MYEVTIKNNSSPEISFAHLAPVYVQHINI